jgi:predicted nucleotide-binding protein
MSSVLLCAVPRGNMIFEAAYFTNAKSDQRVLIIREEGAKMPADVGGQIYLSLKDRSDISTITPDLIRFVKDRL